jgi:hypothetical protein
LEDDDEDDAMNLGEVRGRVRRVERGGGEEAMERRSWWE